METSYFKIRNKNTGKWVGIQSREPNGRLFADFASAVHEVQTYHASRIPELEVVKLSNVRTNPDDPVADQCYIVTMPFATERSDILEDALAGCESMNRANLHRNANWFKTALTTFSQDAKALEAAIEAYGPVDSGFMDRLSKAYDEPWKPEDKVPPSLRVACYYAKRISRRLNLLNFEGADRFDTSLLTDYIKVPTDFHKVFDHYRDIAVGSCNCEPEVETLEVYTIDTFGCEFMEVI